MSVINGNSSELIVKNGLVLNLDAGNRKSYISGSTNWIDLSGNNNSGSLKNGTFFTSSFGGGFVFDGVDDYILTPLNIDANPYTVSAWCYPYNTSGQRGIFLTDNGQWDKGIEINGGYWYVHNGSANSNTGVPASVNTWYNCCVVYATDNIYFYVNGVKVWTYGSPPSATNGSTIEIGRANYFAGGGSRFFTGIISTLTAYNRVLSDSEILQNYNANKSRFATSSLSISNVPRVPTNGLILSLDAANAKSYVSGSNTIYDLSGNNITGSVFGNPVYSSEGKGNIVFDGVNDYIQNNGYTPNANTISIWMKISSTSNGAMLYVGNDVYNSAQWSWGFFNYNNSFYILSGAGNSETINPIPTGEWINWTLVRRNSYNQYKIFKNGTFLGVGSGTLTNSYNGFRMGKAGSDYSSFSLANTQIYNRELSPQEIRNIYISYKDKYGIRINPSIISKGIVLNLDASNTSSYVSGSSTWYDLSGNGNNGTLTNGAAYDSAGSGSISFDGVDDYVTIPNAVSLKMANENTSELTMEAWLYPTKSTGIQNVICKFPGSGYILRSDDGWSTVVVYLSFIGGSTVSRNVAWPSRNAWHYVAGVYDGEKIYIYINGALANSWVQQSGYVSINTNPLILGRQTGFNEYYGGKIGEANVYNKALSAAEILAKYNATKGRYGL